MGSAIWLISLWLMIFKLFFCLGRQQMEIWGEEKLAGGGRLSLSGLARFGSVLVGSSFKVSIWCRPDVTFFKISSICHRRGDTRFFECAFGVDDTLVGKCRFLIMCVLHRREANLRTTFSIVCPEIDILVFNRRRIRYPKYERDVMFLKSGHLV